MRQIQERNAAAFEVLFARYRDAVRRHLASTVRDANAAEDLVQEVFLRVWTRAEQWDERGAFKAWLFRIATNLALNHLRSVSRRREQPLEIPVDVDDEEDERAAPAWMMDAAALGPDAALEQAVQRELFQQLVNELPEEKREVFRMVYQEDRDIREVAETLGIPEGTVKSRLHYATKRLVRGWRDIEKEWEEV